MPCDLILALDVPTREAAAPVLHQLRGSLRWVKIGLQMFTAYGPDYVREVAGLGFNVFLDLKLHDIPNTVARAVRSVSSIGASLLTIHAEGGSAMLAAAAEAAASTPNAPRLLAVTVLTSMDAAQLNGIGVPDAPAVQVMRLARLAASAGIDGLVCSPEETRMIRSQLPGDPLLVVPGIRPAGAAAGDQKRVATPASAIADGASMLVVGRPITQAANSAAAAASILAEIDAEMALAR